MKPTSKNIHAMRVLQSTTRNTLELTTIGKVHDSFGILCAFTNRESALEGLAACGFVHDPLDRRGYPVFARKA